MSKRKKFIFPICFSFIFILFSSLCYKAFIYTPNHIADIYSEDEMNAYLNSKLKEIDDITNYQLTYSRSEIVICNNKKQQKWTYTVKADQFSDYVYMGTFYLNSDRFFVEEEKNIHQFIIDCQKSKSLTDSIMESFNIPIICFVDSTKDPTHYYIAIESNEYNDSIVELINDDYSIIDIINIDLRMIQNNIDLVNIISGNLEATSIGINSYVQQSADNVVKYIN